MSVNQMIELYLNKYNDTSNNFIKVFKRSNRAQPAPELRQSQPGKCLQKCVPEAQTKSIQPPAIIRFLSCEQLRIVRVSHLLPRELLHLRPGRWPSQPLPPL